MQPKLNQLKGFDLGFLFIFFRETALAFLSRRIGFFGCVHDKKVIS